MFFFLALQSLLFVFKNLFPNGEFENLPCTGFNHLNYFKAFIKYSYVMDYIYKNIEEYNPNKKRKILIVFDYKIPDMLSNKD